MRGRRAKALPALDIVHRLETFISGHGPVQVRIVPSEVNPLPEHLNDTLVGNKTWAQKTETIRTRMQRLHRSLSGSEWWRVWFGTRKSCVMMGLVPAKTKKGAKKRAKKTFRPRFSRPNQKLWVERVRRANRGKRAKRR